MDGLKMTRMQQRFRVLLSYHMLSPVSDWPVAWRWDALLGVAVAEAAALHNQVVDGEVAGG